jgi:hypothetical protein
MVACLALLLVAAISYRAFRPPRTGVSVRPLSFEQAETPGGQSAGAVDADLASDARLPEAAGADLLTAGEQEWLLACQLPDGAIALTPEGETVVPYFANIAARTMVDIEPERVQLYMSWYIQHMNLPDRSGLSGTIYDYEMRYGALAPTFRYDSADSYAATFLSLASYYLLRTGDRDFISGNLDAIDLAASAILALQDGDGLVMVMPGSRTKYLMDNCESYQGLLDWARALDSLGFADTASLYRGAAETIRQGIESVLYDPARQAYAWSFSWLGKRFPRKNIWYPDNVSQIDVITSGVISPGDPRAARIWEDFNARFPFWDQGVNGDHFPWARVAQAAVMMNDTRLAENFLTWVSQEFTWNGRPYPWHVSESAITIEVSRAVQARAPGRVAN